MGNKIYFILAKIFVSLFHTRRGEGNQKNKAEPRKWDCNSFRLILMAEFRFIIYKLIFIRPLAKEIRMRVRESGTVQEPRRIFVGYLKKPKIFLTKPC